MEAILLRWVLSVLYASLTFFEAIDNISSLSSLFKYGINIFDATELMSFIMMIGAVLLIVVNRKRFADKVYPVLIPLAIIQLSVMAYYAALYTSVSGFSWDEVRNAIKINIWDQIVHLSVSVLIFISFYLAKGKVFVLSQPSFMAYLKLNVTGEHYFKDKVSIAYTFVIGGSAGVALSSLSDAFLRDNGPYRVPFDTVMMFVSFVIFVIASIMYIMCLARSPVSNRVSRFLFTCLFAWLLILPMMYLWFAFLQLIQTVKGFFYYDLMGNQRF